jgi:DNA primase
MALDDIVLGAFAHAGIPNKGGWHRANCPFCENRTGKPDRKHAFGLLLPFGRWHCFKCGIAGHLKNIPDNISRLPEPQREEIEAFEPPDAFLPLYEHPGDSAMVTGPARRYLKSRGLGEEIWCKAHIGVCLSGQWGGRIIVPILNAIGEWLGYVGRAWTKNAARPYLYPKGMQRGEVLYNHAALLVETDTPVMVVEGVFDSLALWPDAVAVLGKPSHFQIDALSTAKRPIAVVLDGDAWREGYSLSMKLRLMGQQAGSVRLPPRTDPDEVDKNWLHERASQCLSE